MKLVSIITPSYNAARYIESTIQSVLSQTYPHWEMIIVDDCSKDNTAEIVAPYLADSRINFIRLPKNSGPVVARNTAIEHSKGQIIAFLDSDDTWYAEKLQKQIELLAIHPDAAIVFADYERMDENGTLLNKVIRAPRKVDYRDELKTCHIGCLTAAYNVTLLGKRYFEEYGHEDYVLWLSILKEGHYAVNVMEVLACYRVSRKSISGNKFKAAGWQWNIYRKVENLNFFTSLYYFLIYSYYGLRKHYS